MTLLAAKDFVTTLPAPMMTPSPIFTLGKIIAPAPIQTLLPMVMDPLVALINHMRVQICASVIGRS